MKGYNGSQTKHSIRDLFQTPQFVFDWYNAQHGFMCDVASSDENHLVPYHLTKDDDALNHPWVQVNWCNPPYSDVMPWVDKAIDEASKGNRTVMLLPADTSVAWFRRAFHHCHSCEFISGRISFINAETGKPQSGNNKGSVVFVFSDLPPLVNKVSMIDRDDMKRGYVC